MHRLPVSLVALVLGLGVPAAAQNPSSAESSWTWTPERLADGQPNITGMWNNSNAMFTPLELPEELVGRDDLSVEELQARAETRGQGRIAASEWRGHENSRGVGGYGTYWFDW
jgi:hypothetical protein